MSRSKKGVCAVDGCEKPSDALGWCRMHYTRYRRTGDPLVSNRLVRPVCKASNCESLSVGSGLCYRHRRLARSDTEISPDIARKRFCYDPVRGTITVRERPRNDFRTEGNYRQHLSMVGNEVGSVHKQHGYLRITVDYKHVMAHRIAWLLHYGELPAADWVIDHINGVPTDNRIENLRLVTNSGNQRNAGLPMNNKSGCRGVYFDTARGKWLANISYGGRERYLGIFEDLQEAIACRKRAEQEHGYSRTSEPSFQRRKHAG